MGLLSLGTPLPWSEAKNHADHVRKHGIIQFLNIWNRLKTRRKDHLYWGDEIEYVVVSKDDAARKVRLSLKAHDALVELQKIESEAQAKGEPFDSSWKPEYAVYMLEATPGAPYGSTIKDLTTVEPNMRRRRALAQSYLRPNETVLTLTSYPHLGTNDFLDPPADPAPAAGASRSLFIPDIAINPHARFPTLTKNIRTRRGSKVCINMPIYVDTNTPRPFVEPTPKCVAALGSEQLADLAKESTSHTTTPPKGSASGDSAALPGVIPDALPDHIYMDCMCFGMGCCCLQVTFQACSVEEARRLYDHLAVVSPIMLALSAAAPIFRGYLADVDCRWDVISASVDDRTKEERGEEPLNSSRFRIPKSRYDSINLYLSPGPNYSGGCTKPHRTSASGTDSHDDFHSPVDTSVPIRANFYKDKYNDLNIPFDKEIHKTLQDGGVDELLARHYAHLFIRDPLVIFEELLEQDDQKSSDHFENIQSTNWQTMRFKPPPPGSPIGWRVEFRSMEIQLTDFENAAFSVFVVLLTRAILSYDLNFYIPLSQVDENMKKAHSRAAVTEQKFWFRKNIFGGDRPSSVAGLGEATTSENDPDEAQLLTINEIINGNDFFPGLVPLIESYLSSVNLDYATHSQLSSYLTLISRKASGELMTAAGYIRKFVHEHPGYKHDSVVSDQIIWDLVQKLETMTENGGRGVPGLTA
ncbi:glutamate-cysteine ligase-domain-containing protein [Polychytrium aggregatum]|uniref:glutamate-cysteine ligase-domain-containing protein n=1 Tax=Polychytrium aggregatum TaxID=110093 RepID=UPI0022FE0505|nr:glutamate-cysteine ligase-domain-containing protein [Polychytrium aggregatum]KAI9203672.1 glutamate-cysteine ligase-domain-containing protein [Polychytrium aggregatum]